MQIPRDIEGTALGLLLAFDTIEVYRQRRAVHLETVLAAAYMVGELKSVCSVCDCPASIGNRTIELKTIYRVTGSTLYRRVEDVELSTIG